MTKIIEGIVLKTTDYQEKSKILQVFSREHGLISIYLRGANEYRQRTYSLAQELTHASFSVYYKAGGLSTSYSGEVINGFMNLKLDFDKNIFLFHLFELLLKVLEQHHPQPTLFDLILEVMVLVDETDDILLHHVLTLAIELKLLYFIGLAPVLDRCVECGKAQNITTFVPDLGGFICRDCIIHHPHSVYYSIDALKNLITLYTQSINELKTIQTNPKVIEELRMIIDEYYRFHLGVKTHSRSYLPKLNN